MPKLNLQTAVRIKLGSQELVALKGPGFSWTRPALPVISNLNWFDVTGTGNFSVAASDEPTDTFTVSLVTYNSSVDEPDNDGSGNWTGTPLETFSFQVSAGTSSIDFEETAASATATHYAFFVQNDRTTLYSATERVAYTHDITGPSPVTLTPLNNAVDVAVDTNLTIDFGETIVEGVGNLYLYDDTPALLETIAIGSTTVGTTDFLINPTSDFSNSAVINVQWDEGIVTDQRGNPLLANADPTLFRFTVIDAAAAWSVTDNGDGNYTVTSSTASPSIVSVTDNGDGTYTVT